MSTESSEHDTRGHGELKVVSLLWLVEPEETAERGNGGLDPDDMVDSDSERVSKLRHENRYCMNRNGTVDY